MNKFRQVSLWILTLSSIGLLTAPSWADFSDTNSYWAGQYISSLAQQQVIGGFPDGRFRPNDPVTRAQFASIVTKAFGLDTNAPPRQFQDPIPGWAAPSINAAAAANFISGFPDGTFRPNDVLTRAQAITVLTKAAVPTLLPPDQADPVLSLYADGGSVPNFARASIATATQQGLLVLYPNPNLITATAVATRGEVAALTYLALAKSGKVPALPIPPGAAIPALSAGASRTPTPTIPTEALSQPPKISKVFTRDETSTAKPGSTITLYVLATAGSQGSFTIQGVVEQVPLQETRPGQYEGSYTFRLQDRANQAPVTVRLEQNGLAATATLPGQTVSLGSSTPASVGDNQFPDIEVIAPAKGATIRDVTPQISGRFRDNQGIDPSTFALFVNRVDVTNQARLNQNRFVYTPNSPLPNNRPIVVVAQISDLSGNTALQQWSFTINP